MRTFLLLISPIPIYLYFVGYQANQRGQIGAAVPMGFSLFLSLLQTVVGTILAYLGREKRSSMVLAILATTISVVPIISFMAMYVVPTLWKDIIYPDFVN